jgi:choline kinase
MHETHTSQAVILAAGRGSRLAASQAVPSEFSKPLLRVGGRSLLEHCLQACSAAGLQRAVVVTGYRADLVREELQRIDRSSTIEVHNDRWNEPNGVSVLAARSVLEGDFLLLMADHLFDPSILTDLMDAGGSAAVTLATDYRPEGVLDLEDATKVRVIGSRIVAIGKDLADFNAVDCGLFYCTHELFAALDRAARNAPPSLTAGLVELIDSGTFSALDIGDRWWQDVDTPEMARAAEESLAGPRSSEQV